MRVSQRKPQRIGTSCDSLPHSNHLNIEELEAACEYKRHWLDEKDCSLEKRERDHSELVPQPLDSHYITSLQSRLGYETDEGSKLGGRAKMHVAEGPTKRIRRAALKAPSRQKVIRREFRMLSEEQRGNITRAMNALKKERKNAKGMNIWDVHTVIHYPRNAPGAHWGPGFLPWHREFFRQFEVALQGEVPGVALPYWDPTLELDLPQPRDSVLWTEELLGDALGYVRTGPFKDWDTNVLMPRAVEPVKKLYRQVGNITHGRLLTLRDVEWIVSRSNFSELTFCRDRTFETLHAGVHSWVGGFMSELHTSPNDPVFYMYHAYLDYLWEQFRQRKQTREQRERGYSMAICNKHHASNSVMAPFKLRNRDGLSNDYTDYWYEYEPVRHCTKDSPTCDSPYLFCHSTEWRCVSRVQLGGNCSFTTPLPVANESPCYKSLCIEGMCRPQSADGKN